MHFLWPHFLLLWLLLPALVALYLWLLRRKKRATVNYPNLGLIRAAITPSNRLRRHVPPALLLLALAALFAAAARPVAVISLPSTQQTILLAMDVSGSMRATDVQPNRLVAAQTAAKAFLTQLPRDVKVGIVAFAGSAQVAQIPTLNREDLVSAIDRFQLQRGTAIGNGIVLSLATLFPNAGIDLQKMGPNRDRPRGAALPDGQKSGNTGDTEKPKEIFTPLRPGSYGSAAIILLTDGQRTTGVDSMEAAKLAADRGVKVYTVGIGTVGGETIGFEGWSMRVRLDEETLKAIANTTQADYFYAGTAADLQKVYEHLSTRLTVEKRETEISALFALLGALLAVLAAGLSLWWFGRVV
jgi:Ca-activated chloride channel homolog